MIVTTTQSIEGYKITGYYGIVFGEVITGINIFKDFGAGIRNIVGGRSQGYEDELLSARTEALQELEQRAAEMGAHAVVGVDMDYEVLGQGNMLMVTASGTAVTVEAVQLTFTVHLSTGDGKCSSPVLLIKKHSLLAF